jgi:ferritin-like metal-binding protein YciE
VSTEAENHAGRAHHSGDLIFPCVSVTQARWRGWADFALICKADCLTPTCSSVMSNLCAGSLFQAASPSHLEHFMATAFDHAKDIYITGLRNQHAVENQAIELLERQVGRLENYPEMEQRMRRHIEESREQARRLEDLLAQCGTSHSSLKDTVMSFVGNMAALGHSTAPDEVVKNTFANFAFEHYEIASYKSLLILADLAGHSAGSGALQTSLREEQDMAAWIVDHLDPTVRRFVERSAANVTAGV